MFTFIPPRYVHCFILTNNTSMRETKWEGVRVRKKERGSEGEKKRRKNRERANIE